MDIQVRVNEAKSRSIEWLDSMKYDKAGFGVYRCSDFHNPDIYKGELLHGTYDATHCQTLLGTYSNLNNLQKQEIGDFINSFQLPSGVYRNPDMKDHEVFKSFDKDYTWEYIDFHVTNYCMGALRGLGLKSTHPYRFMERYLTEAGIDKWLDQRIMTDPWLEGNNFVNLTSFLIDILNDGNKEAKKLIDKIIHWHDANQDPNTGFWGTNHPVKPATLLYGMGGAAHNYHIYTYFNLPIKHYEQIVDYCIDFTNKGVNSACLDVDVVDILCNMLPYDYRKQDILDALERKIIDLLGFQNSDGGFCDVREGIRRQDGWVGGYWEPQGISNTFATWFRWITIGMAMCCLFPEEKNNWTFRNTIGIGFFNKEYSPQ